MQKGQTIEDTDRHKAGMEMHNSLIASFLLYSLRPYSFTIL
jgi:hypothetical protein